MNLQDELRDFCKFRCEHKNKEIEISAVCLECDADFCESIEYCDYCKVKEFIEQL